MNELAVEGLYHNSKSVRALLKMLASQGNRTIGRLNVTVRVDYAGSKTTVEVEDNDQEDISAVETPNWATWTREELPDIPNVHSLTLHGPALCCPREPYGFLLPLLTRLPNLRALNLLIHGAPDAVPAGIDLHAMVPGLAQLEKLLLTDVPLVLVHALLRKTGPRLGTLIIGGRPVHPRSAQLQVDSDVRSQRSYASSVATSATAEASDRIAHRRELALVLLDLQLQPCPTRVREFWVIPSLEPYNHEHVARVARGAQFLPTFSLLERISHLVLDRWIFSAMMSQNVAPPRYLRALTLLLSKWDTHDGHSEAFGQHCVSVDQALAVLGKQLEAGLSRYLRNVGLAYARYEGVGKELKEQVMRELWADFKKACTNRRIRLWFAATDLLLHVM